MRHGISGNRLGRNSSLRKATVRDIAAHRVLISDIIKQHNGRVVDSPGDNILAEFASVVDAVNGAIKIQGEIKESNASIHQDRRMEFRIGINLGDVIEEDELIYGDGVNIAARVEGLAAGGGIAISGTVYEHIKDKISLGYHYLGEQDVKNIPEPVRVYRLLTEPADAGKLIGEKKTKSNKLLWAAAGAIVLIILGLCTITIKNYYFRPSFEPASVEKMAFPLPEKPSIAVLPFDNMSGDPGQEFLGDGIAESIINALSQDPDLFVIARNSTFSYKGKPVKFQKVAEELGVQYVLEGSVQKSGERIRITAQLVDAISGLHLWAEQYDKNLEDLFALQDEIIIKILTALRVKLTSHGEQVRQVVMGTNNLKAFLKFLKAREYQLRWNKDDNLMARQAFEEVIALDPNWSYAYSTLAWTYLMDLYFNPTKSPRDSIGKALELVQKALDLDDTLPFAIETWGYIYMLRGEHDKALAEYDRAIALNPNLPDILARAGITLTYVGRIEEAITSFEKAIRLNPIPPGWYLRNLARCYRMVGRYEDSISTYKGALDRSPNDLFAHAGLTATYSVSGRLDEARAQAAEVVRVQPKFSVKNYSKRFPFTDKAEVEKLTAALLNAGLPDKPPPSLPDKPSLAVLPFVNMSGDQEQDYFSDGISEEIITALSKTPKLLVIARTSSFKYKGKQVDIRTVGMELGVRYVLEGSVRKAGDKVRITAQLIDATTEKHLWAERYDRNLREIFDIQDEITLAIIKAMQVELTKGEMSDLTGRGTKNLDAYLKALQAQEQWWRMDKQGNLKAKQLALKAIAIDGQYGYPYAILSWSHMMEEWLKSSESPKESLRLAGEAIQKALILDESDYRIHIVLSNLYIMQRENDKAISSAQRAVELCPGGAFAHAVLGTALRFACRFDESVQFREQAIRLDPFPIALEYRNLAVAYSSVGRYDDAITEYKKALHTNPNDWAVHFGMVGAYARLNRKEEARIAAKELLRVRPDFSLDWLAETIVPMYAKECRSKINDDIEFLRKADVGLQ